MNPEIESTHKRYEQFTNDEELQELYEARVKYQRDVASLVESGHQKGIDEGKVEALIQLLDRKFGILESDIRLIKSINNPTIIDDSLDQVLSASTLVEIMELFKNH